MDSEISKSSININNYNSNNGKLKASINWLITRIYGETGIPDNLQCLFFSNNEGNLQLSPVVVLCLTNGSFYTQAASKILRNNSILVQGIGGLLRAFSEIGIEIREIDGGHITEEAINFNNPIKINTHLAIIDALMNAHLKSIISIEKVVHAISAYTPVEKREEPLDCVDSLLFWINKICLLVRDDVEKNGIILESQNTQGEATVPEMEDLYEDLCDGTCVCVLLAFYRPHEVDLQGIFFNDPMSINDCRFNLSILKNFCENYLPWNPFHLEIEDILYLHESLQPNVNALLADLFYFFETLKHVPQEPIISPVQRRFVPVQGIPDLRAQNIANRSPYPPPKINRLSNVGTAQKDRTTSIASIDSLMTSRSNDSLKYPTINNKSTNLDTNSANITKFGELQLSHETNSPTTTTFNKSMDSYSKNSAAEAKLQIGELKRHFERNKMLQSAMNEEKRNKAGKDAFFRIMSKSANEEISHPENEQHNNTANATVDFQASREEILSAQVQDLQDQINSIKFNNNHQSSTIPRDLDNMFAQLPYKSDANLLSQQNLFRASNSNLTTHHPSQLIGGIGYNNQQQQHQQQQQQSSIDEAVLNIPQQNVLNHQQQQQLNNSQQLSYASNTGLNNIINPQQQQQRNMGGFYSSMAYEQGHYALPQTASSLSASTYIGSPYNLHNNSTLINNPQQQSPYSTFQFPTQQQQQNPQNIQPPNHFYQQQQQIPSSISQSNSLNLIHQQQQQQQPQHLTPQQQLMQQQQQQFPTSPYQNQYYPSPQQQQQPFVGQTTTKLPPYMQQQQQQQTMPHYTAPNQNPQEMSAYNLPFNLNEQQQQHLIQQQQQQQIPDGIISPTSPYNDFSGNFNNHNGINGVGEKDLNNEAFRLHQPNASTSRLDPPLQLNRNLINWGLTFKSADRPPRKTWANSNSALEQKIFGNNDDNDELNIINSTTTTTNNTKLLTNNIINNNNEKLLETNFFGLNSSPQQKISEKENEENSYTSPKLRRNQQQQQQQQNKSQEIALKSPNFDGLSSPPPLAPQPTSYHNQNNNINKSSSLIITDRNPDENPEMTLEMQAKRRALLASQIKRKEKITTLSEEKEVEIAEKRQMELQKQEQAEQRKLEREMKRQKLLEEYKRKKLEQELGEIPSGGSNSARINSTSTISLNRGHSQPPFCRPKSQSNMHLVQSQTLQRTNRAQSSMANDENVTPRIRVASIAEPTLKLFAKHQPKSNRILIINALQYSIFPGVVSSDQKNKVQAALAQSDSKHFLILFRDHKCQYRGLYTWDQISDTAHKIDGQGPKICKEDKMSLMFKAAPTFKFAPNFGICLLFVLFADLKNPIVFNGYDSGAKHFSKVPTKHLSATIDGFTIPDQFWQKPKIPHSSAR